MARRAPSTMVEASVPRCARSLVNSRKPASKMRSRLPIVWRLLTAPWYRALMSLPLQNSRSNFSVCSRALRMAIHLRKMNIQDMKETASSSSITAFTTSEALATRFQRSMSCVMFMRRASKR